jgi:hypothetical protein
MRKKSLVNGYLLRNSQRLQHSYFNDEIYLNKIAYGEVKLTPPLIILYLTSLLLDEVNLVTQSLETFQISYLKLWSA